MELLYEYVSAWSDYYESDRNESLAISALAEATPADVLVFALLELLSTLGIAGNVCFLCVIFRYRHFHKPSYVLLLSLAVADLLHCVVMVVYFYPPIATKVNPFSRLSSRLVMCIEWAAWGITLSHMLALSTDRFMAVTCCYSYSKLVTAHRAAVYAVMSWCVLFLLTVGVLIRGHCCLIIPAPDYYTFTFESAPKGTLNIYQKIFVPFESLTAFAVGLITPLTLFRYCVLRRRLKRDRGPTRRSLSKREGRVLLQIAVVTLIFFTYMINYYLFYYIIGLTSKWGALFNSLFYCCNSMVHPFIYFGFNRQLRKQLCSCRCTDVSERLSDWQSTWTSRRRRRRTADDEDAYASKRNLQQSYELAPINEALEE